MKQRIKIIQGLEIATLSFAYRRKREHL